MKNKLLLIFIIIVAIILHFYNLGTNPPALTWDEASWGYNAYSLGIDGKDEFGRFLPYDYLESFGDYKPPVYAYLAILPVKLFGLTPFATRFPSAFFGVLTVLITYFLVKQIFPKSKHKEWYGLVAAFMLAISPWHLMLSRAAFEANIATFLLILGVWLFLYSIQQKIWFLPLAAISFVISIYTFNSARIVAPLLVLVLAISFWKKLWQNKKVAIIAGVIGIVLILPIVGFLRSPEAKTRFQEVNIFTDLTVVETSNQNIANDHNAWWSKIIHNWRISFGGDFLQHYLDNLSPNFLFIHGDGNPKFSIQDVGQMYLWDIPFFIAGILFLFKKREGNWWLIP
ncbi:MAG TPA: glycosyltransferase family 39 protein, partial [Candidatus Saccharimonadales bacterium]|nr:glycosyltransferase family 39 protein [Candidatus Saccharimonadales bacterium]